MQLDIALFYTTQCHLCVKDDQEKNIVVSKRTSENKPWLHHRRYLQQYTTYKTSKYAREQRANNLSCVSYTNHSYYTE